MKYRCYECNGKMVVHPDAEDWMVDDDSNKILWCTKCGIFASESDLKIYKNIGTTE